MKCHSHIWILAGWLSFLAVFAFEAQGVTPVYRAFSFNGAQREIRTTGHAKPIESELGGITTPIALVYDEAHQDLILVGKVEPAKEPLSLNDAVVAMRAVLKYGKIPLVSIDRTPNSERSGGQFVRFDGGIENTEFGRSLLESDKVLKKMGLGILPGVAPGAKSYAAMVAERWMSGESNLTVMSRFWFVPSDNSLVATNRGIAYVDHLSIAVLTQLVGSSQAVSNAPPRDKIAEVFSRDLNQHMDELVGKYPCVDRLRELFRITGLMEVLADWKRTYGAGPLGLSYWVDWYPLPTELTADRVDLLSSPPVKRPGDNRRIVVDGGIDLTMLLTEWKEGSSSALRQLVILSRPATNSVVWAVPLDQNPSGSLLAVMAEAARSQNAAAGNNAGDEGCTLRCSEFDSFRMSPGSISFQSTIYSSSSMHIQVGQETASDAMKAISDNVPKPSTVNLTAFQLHNPLADPASRIGVGLGNDPFNSMNRPQSFLAMSPTFQNSPNSLSSTFTSPARFDDLANLPNYSHFNYNNDVPNMLSGFDSLNVKGVLLQRAAHLEGEPMRASELGLVFEDANGGMDLTKLRRLETAMWAAYLSVEGPGISIDPAETENGKINPHVNTQNVRYIGAVHNTDLGRVMRETDYLMKRWAIGTYRPEIADYLNTDEISNETGHQVLGRASRFWLLPQGIAFKRAGGMLVLSSGHMTVQTEYLENNPNGEKNPENELFAEWFTSHYNQIASKYPIYQELFEYAQLVGLATYLREQKMPLLWFLLKNREMMLTEQAIEKVPLLLKRASHWYVNLSGGVELQATETVRNQANISDDKGLAKSLGTASATATNEAGTDRPVAFTDKDINYSVSTAGSFSPSGTAAQGDIIQTDYAHFEEYQEMVGTNTWKLTTPGLELIRHYSPERQSAAQFGPGWHLAVPFHLTAGNGAAMQHGVTPDRLEVHNVLSGHTEVFQRIRVTNNGRSYWGYEPLKKDEFKIRVTVADGAWLVEDCLDVKLRFDADGDLTRMELRPDKELSVKLGKEVLPRVIPGYMVLYHYSLGGNNAKRLDAIQQGETKAELQWDEGAGTMRIAAITIKRVAGASQLIQYKYSPDGKLGSVQTIGGNLEINYQDNGMRVVAYNK